MRYRSNMLRPPSGAVSCRPVLMVAGCLAPSREASPLIAAPGSGYGSKSALAGGADAEPAARGRISSQTYHAVVAPARSAPVAATGPAAGQGGVCGIRHDASLSVATMARHGRSRCGGGPFHAKSTPA